ncbi:MAG: type II secretory pathway, component PulD [Opitutales bacterium]
MKEYLAARLKTVAFVLLGAAALFTLVAPAPMSAQDASEKIQLMAETLRARDSGDLEQAKAKAEELIKIAPDDENVQRLLASINRDLDRSSQNSEAQAETPVFGQAEEGSSDADMEEAATDSAGSENGEMDDMIDSLASAQKEKIEAAEGAIAEAELLARMGNYEQAQSLLDTAADSLTLSIATEPTLSAIEEAQADVILTEIKALAEAEQFKEAETKLTEYLSAGGSESVARTMAKKLDRKISDPYQLDIETVSPEYDAQTDVIRDLLARGRAQFLNGDYDGAQATFREVEARDANNKEAKLYQTRIAKLLSKAHEQNLDKTRAQMMSEIDQQWERPKVFDVSATTPVEVDDSGQIQEKLNEIVIPQVNFSGMELTRVIETLSELSVVYDTDDVGVNIIPIFNPNETNPKVNISLRNLSLDRVLQFVTQQINFAYDVGSDAVTIQPSDSLGGSATTVTEFFPVSRATIIRLTGFEDNRGGGGGGGSVVDPFAPADSGGGGGGNSGDDETEALENFFQRAGVNFELPGTSLAFDGEQLIVTQSRRNLERMRNILRNYNEVKQVEIETKFLEVSQNDLEEFGVQWGIKGGGQPLVTDDNNNFPITDETGRNVLQYDQRFDSQNRSVNDAFQVSRNESSILVNGEVVGSNAAPDLTSAIDLAANASSLFTAQGWSVNGYDVDFALRALARETGSDLMSAPKVTVLSGKRANITVAQELRYPESYGDIESTAGGGGGGDDDGGDDEGSSISIIAGTPQDFVTRNVGVEMAVTPNVANDDTISLILEPRVTEFEGFVEYGGPSIAISGETTVTVPAGFYQPVFSTREISTEVTVFDGATLVMGGLTRDEVKTVKDKVPVLGDIPGVGRLFRSEGETRQKRNLLIFVTANLVSPGGSPARQNFRNVNQNSLFQNPTIMVPSGSVSRSIDDVEEAD